MKTNISFIVPSYEQGEYLQDALNSISSQGLVEGSFEVLVFDGGSLDNTIDILSNHPVIDYWESVPDRGQAHALNKGFLRAKGEVIGWLNSDDYYLPSVLPGILEEFANDPQLEVLYGKSLEVDEHGCRVRELPVVEWSKEVLLDACIISQPACFFRKRFMEKNGLLHEDLHLTLDYEYWLRACDWMKIRFLPRFMACSRRHDRAKSQRLQIQQMQQSAMLAYKYSGEWREVWLRRIASAKGRHLLAATPFKRFECLRIFLSSCGFYFFRFKIWLWGRPFRYADSVVGS